MINQYDLINVTLEYSHYFFDTLLHTGEIPNIIVRDMFVYNFWEVSNENYYYRCKNKEAECEFIYVHASDELIEIADRISEDIQDLFDRVKGSEKCMKK